jgi:hypothetical protein
LPWPLPREIILFMLIRTAAPSGSTPDTLISTSAITRPPVSEADSATCPSLFCLAITTLATLALCATICAQDPDTPEAVATGEGARIQHSFQDQIRPLLEEFCLRCHNAKKMKSGIRVDHLNGGLEERHLALWREIQKQAADEAMPPEDESQPTDKQRRLLVDWIEDAMAVARARVKEKNGSVRRLTVSQFRNTLRDLLRLEDHLTNALPPDGVSREGFSNNGQTMSLSPLLVEAYFDIAEKALDLCIVDKDTKPVIQNFRVDLGAAINPSPYPDKLVLGTASRLLGNDEFVVTQLTPTKPFAFVPFFMRTKYRFIEGYQGNATVRGWREYDSIYHSVFAGMRGTEGYPKGLAYQLVPEGLLLRPAIPSSELYEVESTYGPRANFKISVRELPNHGRFRVTVRASRYDDGLLLDQGTEARGQNDEGSITVIDLSQPRTVEIDTAGLYQVDVSLEPTVDEPISPNDSNLHQDLIGAWKLDGDARSNSKENELDRQLDGHLVGNAKFIDSPFGKAVSVDGESGAVVIPRDDAMNINGG